MKFILSFFIYFVRVYREISDSRPLFILKKHILQIAIG